ncbi:hypothetical protein EG329_008467 [Mollisiaceae sp. DMI_Dod_QoI]|nr:hypothetical protein EG329_008467 [Helotiales sp. DMI_Dod_QoI]
MSSGTTYSANVAQEVISHPDIESSIPNIHKSEDFDVRETSFTTALSQSPNIDWDSFNVWNYNNTSHAVHFTNTTPTTTDKFYHWSPNPAILPSPSFVNPTPSLMKAPLSGWNGNLTIQHPQKTYTYPITQLPYPPFSPSIMFDEASYTSYHGPGSPDSTHNTTTSPPESNNTSPPCSRRGSKTRPKPKPKLHQCPNCQLTFARTADLQRHISGVHLRIRHHCHKTGCSDNHGKGYCRQEKLKKHVLDTHGHF